MLSNYELVFPQRILFGAGCVLKIPSHIPRDARILLVEGTHFSKSNTRQQLLDALRVNAAQVLTFSGIPPEPTVADVDAVVDFGRTEKVDAIAAVGGGSVIDVAKAAAAIIPAPGRCADYFEGRLQIQGKGLFMAAAPTTAGTGAEITMNSVLIDADSHVKKSIRHPSMTPDAAFIDPELTLSCPPALTAASGMDALTQALESFYSTGASIVTRQLAISASLKLMRHLPVAFECPDNIDARTEVAEASMLTAMAFAQSGLGAVHAIGHPLGSMLKLPHGLVCAALLPRMLRWNLPVVSGDLIVIAFLAGHATPEGFIDAVESMADSFGIPRFLSGLGLHPGIFPFILKNCRSGSMKTNPRPLSDHDVLAFLDTLIQE